MTFNSNYYSLLLGNFLSKKTKFSKKVIRSEAMLMWLLVRKVHEIGLSGEPCLGYKE